MSPTPILDVERVTDPLKVYAENPLFRSAQFSELVIDDNPYRRPVRPEDLTFIDYSTPITRARAMELSSLIAHRMLLNIYDTRRLLLPVTFTPERWADYRLFYSEENRLLGDAVRPFLERHVFSYVTESVPGDAVCGDVESLGARLSVIQTRRQEHARDLGAYVAGSPDPARATTTMALQLQASALNAPLRLRPGMIDVVSGSVQGIQVPSGELDALARGVCEAAGLAFQPHWYYQYYLPSTLAIMNYLNAAFYDHTRAFRFVGAMCARTLDSVALLPPYAPVFTALVRGEGSTEPVVSRADVVAGLIEGVVRPLADRWGPGALAEIARGVEEYTVLQEVHDGDLMTQLRWVDSTQLYTDKARRLERAIRENGIQVKLDTFVESWEECSTTHVHDEDRLLIIESGEMEFWNCFGATHQFKPGDMLFIPKHRLHGSVVQSGECVYHQPVITAEIDRRYG